MMPSPFNHRCPLNPFLTPPSFFSAKKKRPFSLFLPFPVPDILFSDFLAPSAKCEAKDLSSLPVFSRLCPEATPVSSIASPILLPSASPSTRRPDPFTAFDKLLSFITASKTNKMRFPQPLPLTIWPLFMELMHLSPPSYSSLITCLPLLASARLQPSDDFLTLFSQQLQTYPPPSPKTLLTILRACATLHIKPPCVTPLFEQAENSIQTRLFPSDLLPLFLWCTALLDHPIEDTLFKIIAPNIPAHLTPASMGRLAQFQAYSPRRQFTPELEKALLSHVFTPSSSFTQRQISEDVLILYGKSKVKTEETLIHGLASADIVVTLKERPSVVIEVIGPQHFICGNKEPLIYDGPTRFKIDLLKKEGYPVLIITPNLSGRPTPPERRRRLIQDLVQRSLENCVDPEDCSSSCRHIFEGALIL